MCYHHHHHHLLLGETLPELSAKGFGCSAAFIPPLLAREHQRAPLEPFYPVLHELLAADSLLLAGFVSQGRGSCPSVPSASGAGSPWPCGLGGAKAVCHGCWQGWYGIAKAHTCASSREGCKPFFCLAEVLVEVQCDLRGP